VRAFEHDPPRLQHIPIVAGFERFRDALLHQEQSRAIFLVQRRDAVEDQIGYRRRQALSSPGEPFRAPLPSAPGGLRPMPSADPSKPQNP
jgi:hypothetical protein